MKSKDDWSKWMQDADKKDHTYAAPIVDAIWALTPRPQNIQEPADFEENDVRALGVDAPSLEACAVRCWRVARKVVGVQQGAS